MKKKVVLLALSLVLLFSIPLTDFINAQSTGDKLKEEIKQIKEAHSSLEKNKDLTEEEIELLEKEQKRLFEEVRRVDLAITEASENIQTQSDAITKIEEEIELLRQDITVVIERLLIRDELLKNRMRSIQENGGVVDYLNVILGAKSFGDFLDRVGAVTTIVEQDKLIIQKHQNEMEQLEEMKNNLSEKLTSLEEQLVELEQLKEQLKQQRTEKEQYMNELKWQEEALHEEMEHLEEEEEILIAQEEAAKKALKKWQVEEKKRKERERLESLSNLPVGTFIRPSTGPVTSHYGPRWGRLHSGIDIGKRGSNVSIKASAPGIVFRSYYSRSYGNVVFITHNIQGHVFTTLYAHLERRDVVAGQEVKQGQHLGYMGNTGYSFGAHLHFEIHEGTWNSKRTNSVDPRKYISF